MLTVVIPAYNAQAFIGETLQSIMSLHDERPRTIVVNDGSRDDTSRIVMQFAGVQLVEQENKGPSSARNTGLALVDTPYVLFLDADDVLLPGAARAGLNAMEGREDCPFVFGSLQELADQGRQVRDIPLKPHRIELKTVLMGATPRPSQTMFRTKDLKEAGGFDPSYRLCEDLELYTRLLLRGKSGYCHGEPVVQYRRHAGQLSNHTSEMMLRVMDVLDTVRLNHGDGLDMDWTAMRHHWHKLLGGYIPFEIIRHMRARQPAAASRALGSYMKAMPGSGMGTFDIVRSRIQAAR